MIFGSEIYLIRYGRIFNDCKKRKKCPAMENCGNIYCRRVSCTNCNKGCGSKKCSEYERDICLKLEKVPYVCNGCIDFNKCTLTKVLYDGAKAEIEYQEWFVEQMNIDVSDSIKVARTVKDVKNEWSSEGKYRVDVERQYIFL